MDCLPIPFHSLLLNHAAGLQPANNTALSLESEHALNLILGQAEDYRPSPSEEFASSPALYMTRLVKTKIDHFPPEQRQRLGPTPNTVLHEASKTILTLDSSLSGNRQTLEAFAGGICGALTEILTRLHSIHPEFCKAEFFIELAALAWHETDSNLQYDLRVNEAVQTLEAVGKWLGRDGFHKIQRKQSIGQQLFEIFRVVRSRIPKRIFLARWYPLESDGVERSKAELRKEMIDRTLQDLRGEGINLAMDDMGTQTGSTFPIHQKMYDAISNDDIIVIDLSGVRPNVCIEAGYALERHKRERLIFLFQATNATPKNPEYTAPPFDLNTYQYIPINDAAEIPNKLKPHIRTILQAATGS